MKEDYYQLIEDISVASQNGKLTFFVGAGVSKLSNYPSWKNLINKFAQEIGIKIKGDNENYSNEEYLAIPQKYYYYINKNNNEYYKLIHSQFSSNIQSNEIHDLILALKPTNIITTNFDDLIESAITKHGLYYDVIAKDEDVSKAKTSKFILKVHGDLSNDNIVLKEEDYLNYEIDFKLINNILKSIFSTNTVVFIGYGLGDYNIKLILNWVKNVQKQSFKYPYFIYTDDEQLSDLDKLYYESKGIKIIDYHNFTTSADYLLRYKSVLSYIMEYNDNTLQKYNTNSIEYLYKILKPLDELVAIRREDIQLKLKNDYYIDNNGVINSIDDDKAYFKEFNELHINESKGEIIDETIESQYNLIKSVFQKALIIGYKGNRHIVDYRCPDTKFHNNMLVNFYEVNKAIKIESENPYEIYMKAYYLFLMGEFNKAYEIYTDISRVFFNEENYILYYFSQVNRYTVYKALKTEDESSIPDTERLLINKYDIEEIFDILPLDFKNKYLSLRNLYNSQKLYENIYKIVQANKKVNEHIESKSVEFGTSSIGELIGILNDNINFVNGNFLIVDEYSEFKNMVKVAMESILQVYANDNKDYLHCYEFLDNQKSEKEIRLDSIDFMCLTKYFNNNELNELLHKFNIEKLDFINLVDCFNILKNIIVYCKSEKFKFNNLYWSNKIKRYLNNSLQLLKYTKLSEEQFEYIVREIFYVNEFYINMDNKIMFIYQQQKINNNLNTDSSKLFEECLVYCLDSEKENGKSNFERYNKLSYVKIVDFILKNDEAYKSKKIDEMVNDIIDKTIDFDLEKLIRISPILEDNTIKKIRKKIDAEISASFNINLLIAMLETKIINNIYEYEDIVIKNSEFNINQLKVIKNELGNEKKDSENNIDRLLHYDMKKQDLKKQIVNTLNIIAYWVFINIARKENFIKFKGIDDEFDFFVDIDSFDINKFKPEWLLRFNIRTTHENIAKNEKVKNYVKNLLESLLQNKNFDEGQKKQLLSLYIDVYNK